ncbi:MAG: hypothetical protein RL095_2217 [Verrucomicrobiota bacterium]|jgi:hypothetical protein
MNTPRPFRLTSLLLLLFSGIAIACEVPVFRYALERWSAHVWTLKVSHQGDLKPEEQAMIARIKAKSGPNCNVQVEVLPSSEASSEGASLNLFNPEGRPVWNGFADVASADKILASPVRKKLVASLLGGESVVWLLVRSGKAQEDAAALAALKKAADEAMQKQSLSKSVVAFGKIDSTTELDNHLRSAIPLKLSYSIIEIDRQDPQEEILLAMLGGDAAPAGPWAAPVFGRGRALPPLPAERFSDGAVENTIGYVCGKCSCTVQSQNPGEDLLLEAEWASHVSAAPVVIEKALPPLSGLQELSAPAPAAKPATPVPTAATAKSASFPLSAVIVGSLLLLLLLGLATRHLLSRNE